jgi:hypothetical protein
MRWAVYVTGMGKTRNTFRLLVESQREGGHQEDKM